jgi:hypothetical protein
MLELRIVRYASFAARFGNQSGVGDLDVMAHRFHHVIDRQGGNRRPRQGFHFHTGFVGDTTSTINNHFVSLQPNVYLNLIQGQGMAQWNQIAGFPATKRTTTAYKKKCR